MPNQLNLPDSDQERVVIAGGGFAGITIAKKLSRTNYQVVLLDKNNYHQFQPLYYQVAMAGLEPSSISFPFRKLFKGRENPLIRICEVKHVDPHAKIVQTNLGPLSYDHFVIGLGADTNYFNNKEIQKYALPMKSVTEALVLRNSILADFEYSLTAQTADQKNGLCNIVVVGGGPTGVELAGSLAEMRDLIVPKEYPELDKDCIRIFLIEGTERLLPGMSDEAGNKSLKYLKELGVNVILNAFATGYDGRILTMDVGDEIRTNKVIWAAGIRGNRIEGLDDEMYTRSGRLHVDLFNRVDGYDGIYAVGDIAYMKEEGYPDGHPQVAQVAMQQGEHLAKNLKRSLKGEEWKPFSYRDLGSMATIGRHRAVVDLPFLKFQGALAWYAWLVVHLFQILGARNKLFIFLNWIWNYIAYDQSLRLIIGGDYRQYEQHPETLADSQEAQTAP